MDEDRFKPDRPWREIAEEVSTEPDCDKIAELSRELITALDKETNARLQHTSEGNEVQGPTKST